MDAGRRDSFVAVNFHRKFRFGGSQRRRTVCTVPTNPKNDFLPFRFNLFRSAINQPMNKRMFVSDTQKMAAAYFEEKVSQPPSELFRNEWIEHHSRMRSRSQIKQFRFNRSIYFQFKRAMSKLISKIVEWPLHIFVLRLSRFFS